MAGLDTSLVNVGLDTIAGRLSASLTSAQWITSGYLLALAATLPLCGWLSRRFGATRTWLVVIGAFTAASALCAAAPTLPVLVGVRLLQGAAAGVLMPTGQSVMARAAGRDALARLTSTPPAEAVSTGRGLDTPFWSCRVTRPTLASFFVFSA